MVKKCVQAEVIKFRNNSHLKLSTSILTFDAMTNSRKSFSELYTKGSFASVLSLPCKNLKTEEVSLRIFPQKFKTNQFTNKRKFVHLPLITLSLGTIEP